MPWKGTRLFISVFMKNPLLPLWALQIAAALIILKLHIAFALTEPRLIADVGLTDNRCRIRVSSCKPEAAPRGYTCCGPQAPGPLWLQPVERTGDVVSGSWAAGGAHRAGPPGQIAMNACLEFAGRACWDRCSRAGRDGSAAWDQSSMPNFFRRCWDEFLLLPSMQFEAVNFAWCSVDYTMELYKDIATLCRHMEEQCLTHLLHYQYKHSMWHYRKFYPLGFKLRRKILYRLWTCVGVFQLCLTLAIRGYHFPRSCYRMAKSLVSLCGLHGFRSTRPEPSASRTPTTSFSSESRPSPKSGGSGACGAVFKRILLRVLLLFHLNHPTAGARVVVDATATTGAHPHPQLTRPQTGWAKLSGEFSTVRPNFSNTRKRAYKRAVLRAQQHGSTWYRGRQHSYKQLANLENVMGNSEDPGRGTASQSNTSHTRPQDAPFQVLSWNVGGLTNNILDELQVWLSQEANQNIQVVMLQETRWTFSSEWANEHWTFIHTGLKTHRGSGVLTMVSTRLCSSRQVRHTEVQPGRVLHTRIPLTRQGNSLDIVNVYQFPWDFQAPTVELLNKRYNLLQNVEKTVKSVPVRNLCICGGDMNVQLTHMHGLIGTATYLGESTRQTATDAEALREVLQARQLVALNTWSGPRRTVYTFEQQRQEALSRSQIDYLFVRHHQVTTLMRKCKPLAAFPVTAWRASGLHKPLLLSVDYRWKPPLKRGAPSSAQVDAEAVKDGMRQGTEWYMQFQSELQAGLATLAGVNMDTINTLILNIGYKYYPKSRQHRPAYFQSQQVQKVVRTRWQHLAEMRKYSRFGLPKLFLFWKHFAKFRALRRAANKASRTARRDRVDGLLCEAEHFARMNNVHRLYKIVRLLAPKQPCKKVQIYDKDGLMLSNTQEAAAIHDHFCQIFQGGQVVAPWTCSTGVAQFTYEELLTAMKSIPINKATPPHMAPGAVWKAAAEGLADVLHRFLGDLWGGPRPLVPQSWRDGWLALLGKPGKSCRRPGDFRPLCLQDPVGKAVLTLITDRVRPAVQAYASVFPQHAYLPYRSTQGALLYVFEKLRAIRGLLQASKRDIYSKRAGKVAHKFAGGYVLSLDMSGAFDCVPREHIRDSLLEAGVAEAEVVLILTWLHQSTYHLQHGGIPLKIITDRGVRQGCVLSPLIWACYTCYILRRMDARICLHDIQLYADDFLLCKEFRTKQEMLEALQLIPLLMNHLRQFGLKINVSKTVMLVRVAEAEGRAVLSKYLSKSKRGTYFCVPGLALEYIPVKESHTYLGCIISLLDFETLTFRHRLQIGKGQFQRLRSVLTNGKYLSLRRRTRLWQTCIWSSISYGLACCGVSGACMRLLAGTVATQIRAIAKLPRHISRVSNDELYQRVYIQHPAQLLLHLSTNLCDRLAKMKQLLPPEDVMSWPQFLEQALYSQERIQDAAHYQQQLVTVDVEAGVACPVCGLYFSSMAYVKAHITRKHPEQVKPASLPLEQVQREEIAVDGMPVCKTCGKAFGAWRELIEHVRLKRCPGGAASDSVPEPVRPVAKRANLIDNWLSHGASVLAPQLANQPGSGRSFVSGVVFATSGLHPTITSSTTYARHMWNSTSNFTTLCLKTAVFWPRVCVSRALTVNCRLSRIGRSTQPNVLCSTRLPLPAGSMAANMTSEEVASVFGDYLPALQASQGRGNTPEGGNTRLTVGPPAKWPKHNGKGGAPSTWKRQGQEAPSAAGWSQQGQSRGQEDLVQLLAQLCLRQEDALNLMRLDRAFLMSFRTQSPESMLGTLYNISQRWKEQREAGRTDCPLRVALFKCVILELKTRIMAVAEQPDKLAILIKKGWVIQEEGKELTWATLMWSQSEQKDIPLPDMGPLPHSDAVKVLDRILNGLDGNILQRYHSTRPLSQQYAGEMVPFLMEISNRGETPQLVYQSLLSLSNSTVWFMVGARLKTETLKRSPLAQRLQKLVSSKSPP